ncbi:hypothetical protein EV177_008356, partial [Coemansia sp. RSA 1804]
MSPGPDWAATAPLPSYSRRDQDDIGDEAAYDSSPTQPPATADFANPCSLQYCNLLPVPVRHALSFFVDVAQLTMPALFIPELRDIDCSFESLIYRSKKALSFSHITGCNNSNSSGNDTDKDALDVSNACSNEASEQGVEEPGDTFGF